MDNVRWAKRITFLSKLTSIIFAPILMYSYGVFAVMSMAGFTYPAIVGAIINYLQVNAFVYAVCYFFPPDHFDPLLETPCIRNRRHLYMICVIGLLLTLLWTSLLGISLYRELIIAGTGTLVILILITFYWRVSAHAAVFAGIASLFIDWSSTFDLCWFFILLTLVAASRYFLGKHTLMQLVVGGCIGILVSSIVRFCL